MDITQQLWERAYFPFFEGVVKRRSTARRYSKSLATQWLSRDELEARQLGAVNALLAHAKARVPYYRDNERIPSSLATLDLLQTLPILDKAQIRTQGNDMLAADLAPTAWWKSTGGSTGQPLRFAHTALSHDWRTAMSLRGYSWAGAPPGSRQAYIWGVASNSPGRRQQLKERLHRLIDRKKLFNCFAFTPETMMQCYETLHRWSPDVIVGYTNPTYELARFIETQNLSPPKVGSVLCAAEKVHPAQREVISRVFQCDVFDTYGSREFMLIASECSAHQGLHVSMENLIVEVVDDEGNPSAPGETGRILVTDLHNYAMPFLRYEIGDLARVSDTVCACGRELQLLDDIVGRSLDVIRTANGQVIPGELFPHVMKDFIEITRFQVIQENLNNIRLLVESQAPVSTELSARIHAKLVELVGAEFEIAIEPVDKIKLTPSGKHRVTVSKLVN